MLQFSDMVIALDRLIQRTQFDSCEHRENRVEQNAVPPYMEDMVLDHVHAGERMPHGRGILTIAIPQHDEPFRCRR